MTIPLAMLDQGTAVMGDVPTWNGATWIPAAPGALPGTVWPDSAPYACGVGINVGDAVYITAADTIDLADASDPAKRPMIGLVVLKPTPITAVVRYLGEVGGFAALTPNGRYWLSDSVPGALTATRPTAVGSDAQLVAVARNATTLVLLGIVKMTL